MRVCACVVLRIRKSEYNRHNRLLCCNCVLLFVEIGKLNQSRPNRVGGEPVGMCHCDVFPNRKSVAEHVKIIRS